MATTIQPPDTEPKKPHLDDGNSGRGGLRNVGPTNGNLKVLDDFSPEPSRTGVWVGLAAITMSFAAFTSALIVRQATANDWRHLTIPSIVFLNTLVLLASSGTLEVARRRVADFARGRIASRSTPLVWLTATLMLGFVFVAGQYVAWRQLRAEGLYLASNPNSSFFYVLTAIHALHVLGGLAGLIRVTYIFRRPVFSLRRSTIDATSYYWHFMGILWIYVLLVIWIKL
jgi:cytochrome c oxidase subunit III